jgi:integrase/recombinase XerD
MVKNEIDARLKRLKVLYYDSEDNPIQSKPLSNLELMMSYIRQRRNEDLAENTIRIDITALVEFSKVIDKPVKDLMRDDIFVFFDHLNRKSKSTCGLLKIKIRLFLNFVGREDLAQLCTVKKAHQDRKLPEDMLTPEDIELLINYAQNLRDKAYIAVLYESGAREGELEELLLKHVVFDENGAVITLPKGKTGARRIRIVFAAGYLRNWIDNHPLKNDRDSWLWASGWDQTTHVNYKTLWSALRRSAKNSGVKKRVNPHSFRHARATHLAKDLTEQQLKAYLGWTAGSSMAAVYVHLSGKDLDQAILKLNGLATEEMKEDNTLKIIKCPRCKEIQDKKASFCFKCGMPLNETSSMKIESDTSAVLLNALTQLGKNNPGILSDLQNALNNINY